MKPQRRTAAFTLIETIIVIAVSIALFGLMLGSGLNFYGNQTLIAERDNLISLLRNARSLAMANNNQASYGVFIDTTNNQYVVFRGDSYTSRNPDFDALFPKSQSVSESGLNTIVFNVLNGDANASGTIILSNILGGATIAINSAGRIDW